MLGVFLGVVLGYFRSVQSLLSIVIEFLRPMPSVAIIPVAVLMLGIGDSMIVAVTVYASIWPILVNTMDGVRHIESVLIQTGRTFGLQRMSAPAASHFARGIALYRHRSAHRIVHCFDSRNYRGNDYRQ